MVSQDDDERIQSIYEPKKENNHVFMGYMYIYSKASLAFATLNEQSQREMNKK